MALERLDPQAAHWQFLHADHVARYLYATEFVRGKRVLDAGTGPGYGAALLKAAGARSVVAIDCNPQVVASARLRCGDGVEFRVGDCEKLEEVVDEVDVICSFENIEHLTHPQSFVSSAGRVLAADGVLLCSTPDRDGTPAFVNGRPANEHHCHEWYHSEFVSMLSNDFRQVESQAQVVTFAQRTRQQISTDTDAILRSLRYSPLGVVRRVLRRVLRAAGVLPRYSLEDCLSNLTDALAIPTLADYPIVAIELASLIGKPFCHFAVCREPVGSVSARPAANGSVGAFAMARREFA